MNANEIMTKWDAQADVAANVAPVIDDQLLAQVQGGVGRGWVYTVSGECWGVRCDFWNF